MNLGLYASAAGMKVNMIRQDVRANNLANASTPGFKRDRDFISSFLPPTSQAKKYSPSSFVQTPIYGGTVVDMERGSLQETSNLLDVTVDGQGFIEVGQGATRHYIRTASLKVENGLLSTTEGYPVIGMNGPIEVTDTTVAISPKGEVLSGNRAVDSLRIVDLPAGAWAKREDGGLVPVGAAPVPVRGAQVYTGMLEQSNVNSITEMVGMIELYRHYEAGQKAVQSIDETLGKAVNEVGSVR